MKFKKITLLVPVFIGIIIFLCWQLGLLKASQVSVSQDGISCVGDDQLIQDINLKGKLYWEIDHQKLEDDLINKHPCISDVSLNYKFPNQIAVEVTNRIPIASIVGFAPPSPLLFEDSEATPSSSSASLDWSFPELAQKGEVVDSFGKVFALSDTSWLPLILFDDPNLKLGSDFRDQVFSNLSQVLKKLPEIGLSVYRFKVQENQLLADSTPKVVLNLESDIARQLASLQLILSKTKIDSREVLSIDLRFNKPVVVYSPKK
jgi:hypothetical protein